MDEDSTQSEKLAPQASKPVPDKDNTVPGNPDEAVLAGWESMMLVVPVTVSTVPSVRRPTLRKTLVRPSRKKT